MQRRQGVYWFLTIPDYDFTPYLPPGCVYIKGQLEKGAGGFTHWQVVVVLDCKRSLVWIKHTFGEGCHAELSRSPAATDYCWKEETQVVGTQFEIGTKPFQRNSKTDWQRCWDLAKLGDLDGLPPSIRVCHYRTVKLIGTDFSKPVATERCCSVFWGVTGSGKSKRAWTEATFDAYPKDPRNKWWCGYNNHLNVVIDEFRGDIGISHLLRWLDRYPVLVETKGSSSVLVAKRFWITSNIDSRNWYPDLDADTLSALLRRLNITHFT